MKTLHLSILLIILISLTSGTSLAIPSGPEQFELGLQTDKVVYKPGDTVLIHVWGTGTTRPNATIYLQIVDSTQNTFGIPVLYHDTKNLENYEAHFNYTVPASFDSSVQHYRFLIEVYQNKDDPVPVNGVYFVTRDGAQKLVINSISVSKTIAYPGDKIEFSAKVTDGLNNEIHDVTVRGDLPESNGRADYLYSDATYDDSTKSFVGAFEVPPSWSSYPQQNGTYTLRMVASPIYLGPPPMSHDYSVYGFLQGEDIGTKIQIITQTSSVPEFSFTILILLISFVSVIVFYNMRFRK